MKFYIVATPIGNLEDITFRAIATLKSVDFILCEDTRVTKKLLDKYDIHTKTLSYHAQSKLSKVDKIFELLEEGKNLALVTDAGTPTISDPGSLLVSQIKDKFGNEVEIIPIPGASALVTALSASGIISHEFTFLGFLPHKKGRETLFKEIANSIRASVFYESPHRIIKTLEALEKFAPDKKVTIARELTKIYEQFISGNPKELILYFENNKDKVRGEFVVIVE
jgi:16S rRNA (cytidine1402-2'-O)-methyltransferase